MQLLDSISENQPNNPPRFEISSACELVAMPVSGMSDASVDIESTNCYFHCRRSIAMVREVTCGPYLSGVSGQKAFMSKISNFCDSGLSARGTTLTESSSSNSSSIYGSRLLCSRGNGLVPALITWIECSGRYYATLVPMAEVLVVVKPETVIVWHRAAFWLFWRW
jgi:hypothetical protein